MNKRMAALGITVLTLMVFGVLWYVAGGLRMVEVAVIAAAVSLSVAYLFYEALSCRKIHRHILGIRVFRRLDLKEFSRIFGAVTLLPLSSVIVSRYALDASVSPIRLYVLFVLLLLVGWALGTVETSKLIAEDDPTDTEP
ncbi:MAG: hypothetical protein KGZ93_04580 [Actinobacteria bacterium]|nr:hypothetical protein [Actinomycetota bacterium]